MAWGLCEKPFATCKLLNIQVQLAHRAVRTGNTAGPCRRSPCQAWQCISALSSYASVSVLGSVQPVYWPTLPVTTVFTSAAARATLCTCVCCTALSDCATGRLSVDTVLAFFCLSTSLQVTATCVLAWSETTIWDAQRPSQLVCCCGYVTHWPQHLFSLLA